MSATKSKRPRSNPPSDYRIRALEPRLAGAMKAIDSLAEIYDPSRQWTAQSVDPDVDLIALCDRIVEVRAEQAAVAKADPWAPDDGPLSGTYNDLHDEWIMLVDRLQSAKRPTTPEGIKAAARMAWESAGRNTSDRVFSDSPAEWIRLQVIAWAAGEEVGPLLPSFWAGERLLDGEAVA
jgi:hypothetical protein